MAKYLAAVRYGLMMTTENFQSDVEGLARGMTVIIQSQRGVDWGEIASDVTPVDREIKGLGEILRPASEDDLGIIRHIRESKESEEASYCQARIQERRLPMRLAGVEHLFSGDKIIFYFLSDGRVDFRDLVKDLARRYRTRIEMRQIGVRDESRLLADYGHCGRELCCRTFMNNLEPVTMRMAKMQKTTLDPSKISGHCGRLMCCLRFEDDVYMQLRKELPAKGKLVITEKLQGEVVGQDLLEQSVTIETANGDREKILVADIVEVRPGRGRRDRPGREGQERGRRSGGQERTGARPGPRAASGTPGPGERQSADGGNPEKPPADANQPLDEGADQDDPQGTD